MLGILIGVLSAVRSVARSRVDLLLEIAALREQLEVYRRQVRRPKLRRGDGLFWIWVLGKTPS